MNEKQSNWYMFFLGLFLKLQVHLIGYIGLSELIVVFIAPFVYLKNYAAMKRDGMSTIMNLATLAILGCIVSSIVNGSGFACFARGLAQTYVTWAALVVGYHLLKRNIMSYRWFILGLFISGLVSIYMMQGASATVGGFDRTGEEAVEAVTSSVLFLTGRVFPIISLPISMFYLHCPYFYSVTAPIFLAFLSLYFSEGSGRGGFAISIVVSFLIAFAGSKGRSLSKLKKNLCLFLLVGIPIMYGVKSVYSWAAESGRLGENAERKYRDQTQRGTDILSMLISGRTDFFVGLYACSQKPIVGYGPWPMDKYGYRVHFLSMYGTNDEIKNAYEFSDRYSMKTIPSHSHLIGYWMEYGILGLPFWLYVLWVMFRYFRKDMDSVPALFGWLALNIPIAAWGILFAPYSNRVGIPLIISALILIHAKKKKNFYVEWRS